MRILIALAVTFAALPSAAIAGNNAQANESAAAKSTCVRTTTTNSEQRAKDRNKDRTACRTSRTVPWVVDPTPIFIL